MLTISIDRELNTDQNYILLLLSLLLLLLPPLLLLILSFLFCLYWFKYILVT